MFVSLQFFCPSKNDQGAISLLLLGPTPFPSSQSSIPCLGLADPNYTQASLVNGCLSWHVCQTPILVTIPPLSLDQPLMAVQVSGILFGQYFVVWDMLFFSLKQGELIIDY